jgi:uncharacterized protein YndB with AHSA1/START domain
MIEETAMAENAIEREIFIGTDIDRVWSLVSKAGFWVGDALHFETEANEGETVVIETEQYGRFPVRVDRLEPPRYAAYRWASGYPNADLTETNSTLVEFTLEEQEGGVLLRLRESGFATLDGSDDFRLGRWNDNVGGWKLQLDRLREVAEGVPA